MHFVDGWLDEAVEVNAMEHSFPRYGYKPTHLVIHGTAGGTSAEAVGHYFQEEAVESSTHFVIGTDGEIVQCVSCLVAAWGNAPLNAPRFHFANANANPNYWTISIEHCKPHTDNSDTLTPAQQAASFKLVKAICEEYGIAKRRGDGSGGIIAHADINSVDRARCPGPYPWDELIRYINDGSGGDAVAIDINSPGVKNYFSQDTSGNWHSKNGNVLIGGVLGFYKRIGGLTDLGLPLTNEIVISSKPYATIQVFERGVIAYDPSHVIDHPPGSGDTYKAHIDSTRTNPLLANLQNKVNDLQKQIDAFNQNDAALIALKGIKAIIDPLQL